jgi:hypothetical protein
MSNEPNDAASESASPQSTVLHIALGRIKVGFRRRQINPERIADLAESMRDQGQLQPIIVVPSIAHEGCYELPLGAVAMKPRSNLVGKQFVRKFLMASMLMLGHWLRSTRI